MFCGRWERARNVRFESFDLEIIGYFTIFEKGFTRDCLESLPYIGDFLSKV